MAEIVLKTSKKNETATTSDGIAMLLPAYQSEATIGMSSLYSVPIQPSANTSSFSRGSTIKYDLEPYDTTHILQGYFRLKLKNNSSSTMKLVPAPYLFDYIECRSSKGAGDVIFRSYPETSLIFSYLTQNKCERDRQALYGNYNIACLPQERLDKIWVSDKNIIPENSEIYVHIPIPVNFFNMGFIHGDHIKTDLRFSFKCNTDVVISGDVSNLSLEEFELIVDSSEESSQDKQARINKQKSYNHGHIFLDTIKVTYNNKTLTGEQKYYLNSVVGKVPFIAIAHKSGTTPDGTDQYNFLEIGDDSNTYITLENSSGLDLIGNGTRPKPRELYRIFAEKTQANPIKGLYVLDFTDELALKDSMQGQINHYWQASGQKDAVVCQYGTSGTSEVHRVSLGVTATAGHFQVAYDNEISEPINYNASESTIASAINAMRCVEDKGYTAMISGKANTSATIDISFDDTQDGRVSDNIGKPHVISNLVDGSSDPIIANTSIQTYGKKGWSGGSNYSVELFCFIFREVIIDTNGNFEVRDL